MIFAPNQSGAIFGPTAGIALNLNAPPGTTQGGGNLNGTAATSILLSHAGTGADRVSLPRRPMNAGNYCGVI